jgi:hypothetical protein
MSEGAEWKAILAVMVGITVVIGTGVLINDARRHQHEGRINECIRTGHTPSDCRCAMEDE